MTAGGCSTSGNMTDAVWAAISATSVRRFPRIWCLGGMMVNRQDVQLLLQVGRSWAATAHVTKLVARYAVDRVSYGRGTRLVLGSALVARLAATVFDLRIPLFLQLPGDGTGPRRRGRVTGVIATPDGGSPQRVLARHGVVLATGGFASNSEMSAANRPGSVSPHYSMVPAALRGRRHPARALGGRGVRRATRRRLLLGARLGHAPIRRHAPTFRASNAGPRQAGRHCRRSATAGALRTKPIPITASARPCRSSRGKNRPIRPHG